MSYILNSGIENNIYWNLKSCKSHNICDIKWILFYKKKTHLIYIPSAISKNSKNIKLNFHIYLMCWIIIKNHCYCQYVKHAEPKYIQFRIRTCMYTQSNKHHIISWSSISHCIDTGLAHRVFLYIHIYFYISSYRYSIWFYVIFYNNTHIILNLLHYRKSKKKKPSIFFIYLFYLCLGYYYKHILLW